MNYDICTKDYSNNQTVALLNPGKIALKSNSTAIESHTPVWSQTTMCNEAVQTTNVLNNECVFLKFQCKLHINDACSVPCL